MVLPSIQIGNDAKWAAKNGKLLGYYKSLSGKYAPIEVDFSRTTTATRVNKQRLIETVSTGIPRIDYTDGRAKLLMEPSRTNTFANSLLQNGDLNIVRLSATDNDGISPDGTQNATLYESTTAGTPVATTFNSSITTGTYSHSWFFKPVNIDFVGFAIGNTSNRVRTTYDIANDTFLSFNNQGVASGVSAEAKFYANGWYRFEIVVTFSADIATNYTAQVVGTDVYNYPYFTTVTKDDFAFYLWGLQIELGSYPTSYIPTAGSMVTRNEDGINKTSLGLTDCTFFINYVPRSFVSGMLDFYNAANARQFYIGFSSTGFIAFNQVVGGTIGNVAGPLNVDEPIKLAFKLNSSTGDLTIYVNGINEGTFATTISDIDRFAQIASFGYVQNTLYDDIIIFPTQLTNTELAQLTS